MEIEEKIENIRVHSKEKELRDMHYYGNTVRILYMIMALVILVMTPFFKQDIPLPAYFSVFGVMILSVLAGLTSPKTRAVIVFDFMVAVFSLLIFGYEFVTKYKNIASIYDLFFVGNMVLSVLSVFAIYYSSKTLRGNLLK